MSEKIVNMTDPAVRTREGTDLLRWVEFDASQVVPRRGGKAVEFSGSGRYKIGTAASTNLAGWLEMDAVGVAGGHPSSVSAGDKLPVNFGVTKTAVMPTSNRAAVAADIGKTFDIVVHDDIQYVNLNASASNILRVTEVLDASGAWVSVAIPLDKRYGNL